MKNIQPWLYGMFPQVQMLVVVVVMVSTGVWLESICLEGGCGGGTVCAIARQSCYQAPQCTETV